MAELKLSTEQELALLQVQVGYLSRQMDILFSVTSMAVLAREANLDGHVARKVRREVEAMNVRWKENFIGFEKRSKNILEDAVKATKAKGAKNEK